MIKREFGRTGWQVSVIGLGTWNIGNQWGDMDDKTAENILKTAYEHGMNLFDTAEAYGIPAGTSELRLGRVLKGIRDKVFLVSKIGHWGKRTGQGIPKTTADMIRLCGHAIAGRLRTEWVDVVLCHEKFVENPEVYIEGFRALKKEGFIREYGISTDDLNVLKNFFELSKGECSVVEIDYSLINQTPEKELLPFCREKNLGILIRGPFAKGILSGRYDYDTVFTDFVRKKWNKDGRQRSEYEEYLHKLEKVKKILPSECDLADTALKYVISHPANPIAIPGATSVDQVIKNAKNGSRILKENIRELLHNIN